MLCCLRLVVFVCVSHVRSRCQFYEWLPNRRIHVYIANSSPLSRRGVENQSRIDGCVGRCIFRENPENGTIWGLNNMSKYWIIVLKQTFCFWIYNFVHIRYIPDANNDTLFFPLLFYCDAKMYYLKIFQMNIINYLFYSAVMTFYCSNSVQRCNILAKLLCMAK